MRRKLWVILEAGCVLVNLKDQRVALVCRKMVIILFQKDI